MGLRSKSLTFNISNLSPFRTAGTRCLTSRVYSNSHFNLILFFILDLEELINLLSETTSTLEKENVKCGKLLKICASRACRTSIMFGDTLDISKMEKILRNMGSMQQPWNCPHGRPTLRFLCKNRIEI